MSHIKLIFKNVSWLFSSQVLTTILSFFWTIAIARYLGVEDYGIFGFAFSLTTMFAVLCDLGIDTHVVRSIATDYGFTNNYIGNAIPLKLVLSVVFVLFIYVLLVFWNTSLFVIYIVMLFASVVIFQNIYKLLFGTFQAYEKGKYQGIASNLLAILSLVFIFSAIFLNLGLSGIGWAYLLANLLTLLYSIFALLKHIAKPKIKFDFALWKKLLIWGLPFALTSIFYSIYFSIDIVMISQLVGDYATGIYNASYKIVNALSLFYGAFMAVIFPIMSKQYKYNNSSLGFTFKKITKYITIITLCMCTWTMFYSYDLIITMFGFEFAQSAYVLQILIWTICFLFINTTASTVLNASHKEYTVSAIYLIAAIFNVILNLFLIPKYSYIGASFATVISEILILALLLYVLKKMNITVDKKLIVDILKICLSAVILGIFFYFIKLNVILSIPVGLFVFFILLIITRSFDNEDKAIFKEIIRKTD